MTEIYFVCRRGTSERVVDHANMPILVEQKVLKEALTRFGTLMRCHPDDLEAVTPKEYALRFEYPVFEGRQAAQEEKGRIS